jgi:peptidoglycan hydrolase-like protein with peptidoglycan-binding domain
MSTASVLPGPTRRRRLVVALAATLGIGLLPTPGGAPVASAAGPSDVIAVVVDGVGNGHGRGMSQWGAYGWAVEHGWSSAQILDHYFGGTSSGSIDLNSRIRVRLTGLDGAGTVGVISHGAGVTWNGQTYTSMQARRNGAGTFDVFAASSIACNTALTVPDGPVVKGATGEAVRQIQQFLTQFGFDPGGVDGQFGNLTEAAVIRFQASRGLGQDGQWRIEEATAARSMIAAGSTSATFTYIGTSASPRFETAAGESATTALGLCQPNGTVTHYRGVLDVVNDAGTTRVVNDLRVEDYLRGVVPKEISASWAVAGSGRGAQAVAAQAVAARSYGLEQNRYSYASTCDTQSCQVYAGSATRTVATGAATLVEDFRTDQAIAATAGLVRRWPSGAIVSTEFSASNGPRTAGGVFPPRDDAPGDSTPLNPNHRWTRILDADALGAQYGIGTLTGASMVEAQSSVNQQFDGVWFNDIVLTGTAGSRRIAAWDFRGSHGLPSPGFDVRVITRDSVGTNVAVIGDSVGESAKNEFLTLTDGTFGSLTVDTLVSRFITKTPPSPSGVQVAAGVPTNLDLAVVELGYNPSTNMAADVDAMMTALNQRGTKRVVWINMADLRGSYAAANAALEQARSRWPNLAVADWNAVSAAAGVERSRWISSDGVHLTTTGQAQFALWMRQLAGGSGPLGGSGGTVIAPTSRRFQPDQRIELQVVGESVVGTDGVARAVPAGASAVALNITAVTPAQPGFVTVWPCDVTRPDASNLNFVTGGAVANSVIAPVGVSGKVCFYSNQETDFLVDITGWFAGSTGGVATFVGATPRRVVDTRNAIGVPKVRIPAGGTITIPLAGAAMARSDGSPDSIPADATAVAMNVTAVLPSQAGFFTVWPCGAPMPVASNVNFARGGVVANGVVTSLGAGGAVCLYSDQQSDVLVDVLGWFGGGAQPPFTGAVPSRLVDTRNAIGGPTGVLTAAAPKSVPVRGVTVSVNGTPQQVPADASAVALNVTMVEARAAGFATVWPCGAPMPEASNVNFGRGGTAANGVIAPIGADGSVCIFTSADAHVIVDIAGWFTGGATPAFTGNNPRRLVDTRNNIGPAPR